MARTNTAQTIGIIHPASESRIERAAKELLSLREQISKLTFEKDMLQSRICTMIRQEGAPDDEGKIRYETELHKFQIISGMNCYTDYRKLRVAMTVAGITPKVQAAILASCVKKTEYEYPGVTAKKDASKDTA